MPYVRVPSIDRVHVRWSLSNETAPGAGTGRVRRGVRSALGFRRASLVAPRLGVWLGPAWPELARCCAGAIALRDATADPLFSSAGFQTTTGGPDRRLSADIVSRPRLGGAPWRPAACADDRPSAAWIVSGPGPPVLDSGVRRGSGSGRSAVGSGPGASGVSQPNDHRTARTASGRPSSRGSIGVANQRQGYATEAARAMLEWLERQGVVVFIAHIHPSHLASTGVARHLGLTPTSAVVDSRRASRSTLRSRPRSMSAGRCRSSSTTAS
jgi:hypothetical protein